MNKFYVAYMIVLVLFVLTVITAVAVAQETNCMHLALRLTWMPLLINGFLLYALKDWKSCAVPSV